MKTDLPSMRTRAGREAEVLAELSIGPISPEWLDAIPQRRAAWNRMVRDGRIAAPIPADSLVSRATHVLYGFWTAVWGGKSVCIGSSCGVFCSAVRLRFPRLAFYRYTTWKCSALV
jgi:hypothetical protein